MGINKKQCKEDFSRPVTDIRTSRQVENRVERLCPRPRRHPTQQPPLPVKHSPPPAAQDKTSSSNTTAASPEMMTCPGNLLQQCHSGKELESPVFSPAMKNSWTKSSE